ncbi:MAG: hypothetical protein M5R40_12105 [Anaerolineae bacterium]|nr:hypothetical protein [Anaerolineae bacterium]
MRKMRAITLMALLAAMLVAAIPPVGAQTAADELPRLHGRPG